MDILVLYVSSTPGFASAFFIIRRLGLIGVGNVLVVLRGFPVLQGALRTAGDWFSVLQEVAGRIGSSQSLSNSPQHNSITSNAGLFPDQRSNSQKPLQLPLIFECPLK